MKLCQNCGNVLPETKRSHAIFCNTKCKKQAEHRRRIKDPDYRERSKQRSKKWREENPERAKKKVCEWQKTNKSRCRTNARNYSLRKTKACPVWLKEEHKKQIENFYWLAQDLRTITGEPYHVDHIEPLQGRDICGLHVPWNLQILPAELNIGKKNKRNNRPFAKLGDAGSVFYQPETTILREDF